MLRAYDAAGIADGEKFRVIGLRGSLAHGAPQRAAWALLEKVLK